MWGEVSLDLCPLLCDPTLSCRRPDRTTHTQTSARPSADNNPGNKDVHVDDASIEWLVRQANYWAACGFKLVMIGRWGGRAKARGGPSPTRPGCRQRLSWVQRTRQLSHVHLQPDRPETKPVSGFDSMMARYSLAYRTFGSGPSLGFRRTATLAVAFAALTASRAFPLCGKPSDPRPTLAQFGSGCSSKSVQLPCSIEVSSYHECNSNGSLGEYGPASSVGADCISRSVGGYIVPTQSNHSAFHVS